MLILALTIVINRLTMKPKSDKRALNNIAAKLYRRNKKINKMIIHKYHEVLRLQIMTIIPSIHYSLTAVSKMKYVKNLALTENKIELLSFINESTNEFSNETYISVCNTLNDITDDEYYNRCEKKNKSHTNTRLNIVKRNKNNNNNDDNDDDDDDDDDNGNQSKVEEERIAQERKDRQYFRIRKYRLIDTLNIKILSANIIYMKMFLKYLEHSPIQLKQNKVFIKYETSRTKVVNVIDKNYISLKPYFLYICPPIDSETLDRLIYIASNSKQKFSANAKECEVCKRNRMRI